MSAAAEINWDHIGAAAGVVAALVAVFTLLLAAKTIKDSNDASAADTKAHGEQMAELTQARTEAAAQHAAEMNERAEAADASATQHREQMTEAARALQTSVIQHQEQMEDQRQVAVADLVVQRIMILQDVLNAALDLVNVARAEALDPPPILTEGSLRTTTKLPAMQIRLSALVKFLATIGGPNYVADLPQRTSMMNAAIDATRAWGEGITFLGKIETNVFNNPTLEMPYGNPDQPKRVRVQGRPPATSSASEDRE